MQKLLVIPYYTGKTEWEEIIKDKKSIEFLWLEILFNDTIDWENEFESIEIKNAYKKACGWYTRYKTLIHGCIKRKPLKTNSALVDFREYRRFIEVLNFVAG